MLYLRQDKYGASPKAISGRTSYLRVRLEFLPYPHLIATLFNGCAFGPPLPFTAASSWTWVDHPVSGLRVLTLIKKRKFLASLRKETLCPIQTRFPFGSAGLPLNLAGTRNSPDRSTKSTRLCSYGTPTACRRGGSGSLSLPSRGPFHLSFTVLCSIGHQRVFSLAGWSPLLPTGFLVSRGTLDPAASAQVSSTGLSPSPAGLPSSIPLLLQMTFAVLNPGVLALRFGLFRVRSPLLPESIFLSFPPAT